jgi:hypothetical protein
MRLHDLVDDLDLPPTRVADGAWDAAARRVRRRRTTGAAAAAAAVAVVLTATGVVAGRDGAPPPAHVPTTPTPSTSGPLIVTPEMATAGANTPESFERLLEEPTGPPANAPALSTSPIPYAMVAMTPAVESTEVFLLGPDREWRRLDLPLEKVVDDAGYTSSPFRSTSLSPDATMLALPQPSRLVVVDLTDGSHSTYPVPSPNLKFATWLSDSSVVVSTETQGMDWEVDLDDGEVAETRFGPSTGRAPDGQLVTWGMGGDGFPTPMEWDNGTAVSSAYNNTGGLHPYAPLVDDTVVVGHHVTTHTGIGLPLGQEALMVVDRGTGEPVAYLPTTRARADYTTLLGWDDGRIVVGFAGTGSTVVLAAWDWHQKTLDPLVTVAGWQVAWGRGW